MDNKRVAEIYLYIPYNNHSYINRFMHMKIHRNKILEYLKKEKVVTSSEIAKLLKVSWNTAESYLKDLVIDGNLFRIKKEGVNLWMEK